MSGAPIHARYLQRELPQHDRCVNKKKWADQGGKFGRDAVYCMALMGNLSRDCTVLSLQALSRLCTR